MCLYILFYISDCQVSYFVNVLDLVSRDPDVVLVRCIFGSGKPQVGIWNREGMGRGWEGGGQFTSNLGPRWTGSHHAKGGFPSK
jgi:hypothetical protein